MPPLEALFATLAFLVIVFVTIVFSRANLGAPPLPRREPLAPGLVDAALGAAAFRGGSVGGGSVDGGSVDGGSVGGGSVGGGSVDGGSVDGDAPSSDGAGAASAASAGKKAETRPPAVPVAAIPADAGTPEHRLAELIRIRTISSFDPGAEDDEAFAQVAPALGRLWPRVAGSVPCEAIGDRALLYEWQGSDPHVKPAILCAHFDVVPAGDEGAWTHPPFAGDIVEGQVWGRGSQDIKVLLAAILEAAEILLAEGFRPRRSIYFAFGGDEEVGGRRGAARIAALLREKGVSASFLVDEGGPVGVGLVPFADRPVALVAIAEKGYADYLLEAKGEGGHASMPPRKTAVGNLARALSAVEAHQEKAALSFTLRHFLAGIAPYAPPAYRLLFRNLWASAPLVLRAFSSQPTTSSLVRSTRAATMLSGSPKENVLATEAKAIMNARILPGDTTEAAGRRLARLVAPFGVSVRAAAEDHLVEPSRESPVAHEGWTAVGRALATAYPEAVAAPFLLSAGTDTKHYQDLVEAVYRFSAISQTPKDIAALHALDEHLAVGTYRRCVLFYRALMSQL